MNTEQVKYKRTGLLCNILNIDITLLQLLSYVQFKVRTGSGRVILGSTK